MAVTGSNGKRLPRGALTDLDARYNYDNYDAYTSHTSIIAPARVQIKLPRFKNVPNRSNLVGLGCSKCRKKTKPGMVVLDQPVEIGQLIHHVVTCKKCIDRMVGSAPAATDEEAFNQLREQIMKTGKAFPDAEA